MTTSQCCHFGGSKIQLFRERKMLSARLVKFNARNFCRVQSVLKLLGLTDFCCSSPVWQHCLLHLEPEREVDVEHYVVVVRAPVDDLPGQRTEDYPAGRAEQLLKSCKNSYFLLAYI